MGRLEEADGATYIALKSPRRPPSESTYIWIPDGGQKNSQ